MEQVDSWRLSRETLAVGLTGSLGTVGVPGAEGRGRSSDSGGHVGVFAQPCGAARG